MKTFTTPKGSVLPLLDMRGKPYLQVAHRLIWFREEHPDWSIQTELIESTPAYCVAKAIISHPSGIVMSTCHKHEDKSGFPDFREKAETGAIGRALALVGFGTQFCADEMDEGKRIVDSPINHAAKSIQPEPGDGIQTEKPGMIRFGYFDRKMPHEIERDRLEIERDRLAALSNPRAQEAFHIIDEYLKLSEGMEPPADELRPTHCTLCQAALLPSKYGGLYCPNYKEKAKGEHTSVK